MQERQEQMSRREMIQRAIGTATAATTGVIVVAIEAGGVLREIQKANAPFKNLQELIDHSESYENQYVRTKGYYQEIPGSLYDTQPADEKNLEERYYIYNLHTRPNRKSPLIDMHYQVIVASSTPVPRTNGAWKETLVRGKLRNSTGDPKNPYYILNVDQKKDISSVRRK